ncbi:tRNA 2-thiouridine(34) synthase MnmA [Candidatus Azambacteria bacterium RIFCSPHIGHO2_01_FULL_44_55]|uniref:tRNA-specific 2-thiouridylase MnmA n=1 Tax=Candidatus Azambacteria bacterium RIFCSPLOWO2_02_FULL_44_14 TaxID=1797306 RepID=A0A1F5CBX4_9BACT|nr:MAG: tRNA 2-thiouridine(34) synthase MnmA [Candidatus Azambacteria bacterium RIFCSPLOWO2_01_FULL_44_84]OGD33228.1 MAG: tRNA 2-thiouridine(34) synthase MnmA [Candidatus Azambacteria bacterium RIFCSPHIGHO2_02_FULL_45_18]OGD40333.1 MAG: tRNA 2-thiouridine(34) synthase MnmA [Candidatus Azambacteria bacterium RIFCSPLOWO2_02_FULL_44_14]OGD40696.1 MAG: tRNA 2-thiouridine(34) synthase MnmA [Candidatus Azambacteria bacterium RIFCSPHIGHO2_01_FULL_44_55]
MAKKKIKVFVAMSGGVDSSVAAFLLKRKGYDVVGVYMKGWSLTGCAAEDAADARRVAGQMGIPFYVFDFEQDYKKSVVDYMVAEYAAGRTPNPDIMCNREIKFGLFLKKALALGADYIATGHYTRLQREFPISKSQFPNKSQIQNSKKIENLNIGNSLKIENCKLKIAKDLNKDQSYFLWTLTQKQLKYCLFPIGEYKKPQVRAMAKKWKLPTAEKPDSQGVCFIGEIDVAEFLKSQLGKNPGPILTLKGERVGTHDGLSFYTIGQRKGIGTTGGGVPYYVAKKDFKNNTLIVAETSDGALFEKALLAKEASWISGKALRLPLKCLARIRYRQPLQKALLFEIRNPKHEIRNKFKNKKSKFQKLKVVFDEPQRAITPGQSIVFYSKIGEILGGAVIDKTL